ncbi:hypothetical protein T01_9818 [Trichinella spiralis]|uniref:Uncharacterized protein n=1 Tax=Trichinella spiralis TaxID=6334 RepID=A0A0V1C031_TRISP|nr:hypothetical protein T01_9818 [Trichinella spiralis]
MPANPEAADSVKIFATDVLVLASQATHNEEQTKQMTTNCEGNICQFIIFNFDLVQVIEIKRLSLNLHNN